VPAPAGEKQAHASTVSVGFPNIDLEVCCSGDDDKKRFLEGCTASLGLPGVTCATVTAGSTDATGARFRFAKTGASGGTGITVTLSGPEDSVAKVADLEEFPPIVVTDEDGTPVQMDTSGATVASVAVDDNMYAAVMADPSDTDYGSDDGDDGDEDAGAETGTGTGAGPTDAADANERSDGQPSLSVGFPNIDFGICCSGDDDKKRFLEGCTASLGLPGVTCAKVTAGSTDATDAGGDAGVTVTLRGPSDALAGVGDFDEFPPIVLTDDNGTPVEMDTTGATTAAIAVGDQLYAAILVDGDTGKKAASATVSFPNIDPELCCSDDAKKVRFLEGCTASLGLPGVTCAKVSTGGDDAGVTVTLRGPADAVSEVEDLEELPPIFVMTEYGGKLGMDTSGATVAVIFELVDDDGSSGEDALDTVIGPTGGSYGSYLSAGGAYGSDDGSAFPAEMEDEEEEAGAGDDPSKTDYGSDDGDDSDPVPATAGEQDSSASTISFGFPNIDFEVCCSGDDETALPWTSSQLAKKRFLEGCTVSLGLPGVICAKVSIGSNDSENARFRFAKMDAGGGTGITVTMSGPADSVAKVADLEEFPPIVVTNEDGTPVQMDTSGATVASVAVGDNMYAAVMVGPSDTDYGSDGADSPVFLDMMAVMVEDSVTQQKTGGQGRRLRRRTSGERNGGDLRKGELLRSL